MFTARSTYMYTIARMKHFAIVNCTVVPCAACLVRDVLCEQSLEEAGICACNTLVDDQCHQVNDIDEAQVLQQ